MDREYARLRRKTFFVPVIGALVCVCLLLAAGYAWHDWRVGHAPATLVVLMRHAEKAHEAGRDPPLSEAGLQRAERLSAWAADATSRLGFDHVYVTEWQRTQATVAPLLAQHGGVVTQLPAANPAAVADSIVRNDAGRRVLVVAHSDTVAQIVHRLAPQVTVADMADDEYGTTYVVALPRTGRATVLKVHMP